MGTPKEKEKVEATVREVLGDLTGVGFPKDEELDLNNLGSPYLRRKSEGEIIKDRLIASCRGADGWFIVLSKDVGGNDWQIKEKITNYDHWTDLEIEIVDWVRQKTKLENDRTGMVRNYGSGRYRVAFLNKNGNRGEQEQQVFSVDAQEYMLESPKFAPGVTPPQDINEIVKTLQANQPSQEILANTLKAGMEIAANKEAKAESGNNTMMQLILGMMQAQANTTGQIIAAVLGKPAPTPTGPDPMTMFNNFLSTAKTMGAFEKPPVVPQKSELETIQLYQNLGLIKKQGDEDPLAMLAKMKNVMSLVADFTGAGPAERPSIWEKVVEVAGPKLAEIALALVQINANKNAPTPTPKPIVPRAQPVPQKVERVIEQPAIQTVTKEPAAEIVEQVEPAHDETVEAVVEQPQEAPSEEMSMLMLIGKFTAELKDAVINNRTEKYQYITDTLVQFRGPQIETDIKTGDVSREVLMKNVMTLDSVSYTSPEMKQRLSDFCDGYIAHVKNTGRFVTKCDKCGFFVDFDSKPDYEEETDKVCAREISTNLKCDGILKPT